PNAQPYQPDYRKKYDPRRPSGHLIDMLQVRVIEIILERVRRSLVEVGKVSVDPGHLKIHLDACNRCDLVGFFTLKADADKAVANYYAGPRSCQPGQHLLSNDSLLSFFPIDPVCWRKLLKGSLRQI